MKWIGKSNLGMLFLGVWLIATGVLAFVPVAIAHLGLILSALAIAAGVLILLGR